MKTSDSLRLYRSHHVIDVAVEGSMPMYTYRCRVDGIRVIPTRNGKWRHHPDDIVKLLEAEYGGPWGGPRQVVVEDHDGYIVTADLAE